MGEVNIFEKIKREAPPLEDYVDTSEFEWMNNNELQGPHPIHGSSTGFNFIIHADTQTWHCFRKGHDSTGSIIDYLAMEANMIGCGDAGNIPKDKWPEILKYCCEKFGIEYESDVEIDEERIEEMKKERMEKKEVFETLTRFASLANHRLDEVSWDGKTAREHLKDDRAFSDEIIDELKIGFWDETLTKQLLSLFDKESLYKASLLRPNNDSPLLEGWIIFPYWKRTGVGRSEHKHGHVVYFIGRKTPLTKWKDGPKYMKARSGEKTNNKGEKVYPKVSEHIKNNVFYGENNAYGDQILITEGVTDCISLMDAGYNVISPVTTRFRDDDIEKLCGLCKNASEIVIMNDNEKNKAGEEGALKTAKVLFQNGYNVKLSFPPRPPGVDKVDVDDYLTDRGNSAEAVEDLLSDAKSYIGWKISNLREDDMDGRENILKDITHLKSESQIDIYISMLSEKTGATKTSLRHEFYALGGKDYTQHQSLNASEVVEKIIDETEQVQKLVYDNKNKKPEYAIKIRDEWMEMTLAALKGPREFETQYMGYFNEILEIEDSDWRRILSYWMKILDVATADEASDVGAIKDQILSNIGQGRNVSLEDAYHDSASFCRKDGMYLYCNKHILDIRDEINKNVNITTLRNEMDKLIAQNSKAMYVKGIGNARFWFFDINAIDERIKKARAESKGLNDGMSLI